MRYSFGDHEKSLVGRDKWVRAKPTKDHFSSSLVVSCSCACVSLVKTSYSVTNVILKWEEAGNIAPPTQIFPLVSRKRDSRQ